MYLNQHIIHFKQMSNYERGKSKLLEGAESRFAYSTKFLSKLSKNPKITATYVVKTNFPSTQGNPVVLSHIQIQPMK